MKRKIRILEILHSFLLISMLYDLIIQVMEPGNPFVVYQNLLLLPAVAALSVSCRRAKYFWQFFLASAAVTAAVFFLGTCGIWMGICGGLAAFSYFYARAKKEDCWLEVPAYPWLIGYLLLFFEGEYLHNEFMGLYLSVKAAIYFLLYNFYTNLVEMDHFIKAHGTLERLPVNRIRKINQRLMWLFNGTVAAAMIAAPFLGIDGMIRQLGRGLKEIFRWILIGLFHGGNSNEEAMIPQQSAAPMMAPPAGEEETSLFARIFSQILDILGWVIAIALILAVLWIFFRRLYFLYRDFHVKTEENGDRVERLIVPPVTEKKSGMKRISGEHLFWNRSHNARMRKYYKKRVLREWAETPPFWYTPCQLEEELTMGEEERKKFHGLYEKARYGKSECSREEMEELLKIK